MSEQQRQFIKFKIDVTKIIKDEMFKGKPKDVEVDGKLVVKTPVYLDGIAFENKNGPDQYGNTHYIVQSVSKASREAGVKGPIIGNMTIPETYATPKPTGANQGAKASKPKSNTPF